VTDVRSHYVVYHGGAWQGFTTSIDHYPPIRNTDEKAGPRKTLTAYFL